MKWYWNNKPAHLARSKKYEAENRQAVNKTKNAWRKAAKDQRPEFRVIVNLRERLRFAVRIGKGKKHCKALSVIGCTISELMAHLQSKFKAGMNWNNYGKWHIDHIRPCVSFDMLDHNQQRQCFHYTNLQPLWASENLSKGDLLETGELGRFHKQTINH